MNDYENESWIGIDIVNTRLAFDKDLSKLSRIKIKKELDKIL